MKKWKTEFLEELYKVVPWLKSKPRLDYYLAMYGEEWYLHEYFNNKSEQVLIYWPDGKEEFDYSIFEGNVETRYCLRDNTLHVYRGTKGNASTLKEVFTSGDLNFIKEINPRLQAILAQAKYGLLRMN